jgi:hypothetical protein
MKPISLLILFAIATPLHAQIESFDGLTKPSGWLVNINAEFGGDPVVTILFDDGSTQDVNAGQGLNVTIGRYVSPNAGPWMISGGIGFKYVTTKATNADIRLMRYTVDARVDRGLSNGLWVGVGPVAHVGAKLNMDGLGPNVSFDPALGLNARFGWKGLSVTYTAMSYKANGVSFDASAVGFGAHLPF